jgi:hypothetical protein
LSRPSLLQAIQGLLERTYAARPGLDASEFVIGDAGYRRLYGEGAVHVRSAAPDDESAGRGARTLVRETPEGVRAAIYFPDRMIARLEANPPQLGLGDANVDPFAVLVEELDHLLCIAERAREARPISLFELELHADVSKALVLSRFLAGPQARPLDEERRTWLRFHLFHKGEWDGADDAERARYRDAARWALRFLDGMERRPRAARLEALRAFHAATAARKLELIEGLAA